MDKTPPPSSVQKKQMQAAAQKTTAKPSRNPAAPGQEAAQPSRDKAALPRKAKPASDPLAFIKNMLRDDGVIDAPVPNEAAELNRRQRLVRLVRIQNYVIIGLVILLVLAVPAFQPTYRYFALTPDSQIRPLLNLDAPNLTNEAVLSWTTSAVTEIMTVGFGDFDSQILAQRDRFTSKGWEEFRSAIVADNMRAQFKERQLVLTTVPADSPVIVSQGLGENDVYMWRVELPIIMTYMTNNNVATRKREVIALTLTRVPTNENERGLAIEHWDLGRR